PVCKTRAIIHVRRDVASPWQGPLPAEVQRIPLVVIQQPEAVPKRKIREPTINVAEAERQLVRIRQVDLPALANPRRPQRQFPPADARALYCDGEKQVGVVKIIVVEIILRPGQK